ncbi:MAG: PIG-L family deacetylase [Verrucomicrobia bacterium]|nr:PIG-L family deacetylase [Verrucomicrobiota bacterium]
MNPYQNFVGEYVRLLKEGKALPQGGFAGNRSLDLPDDAPNVLIFSPHPDDECIIGGLPLRLSRQAGMRIINVAVTQGSNKARQAERFRELQGACGYLGYGLVQTQPNGLETINAKARTQDPTAWAESVRTIAKILSEHRPKVVFFPHEQDWNSTHIGTHLLVTDAFRTLGPEFQCFVVETEFWGQIANPNLMVESTPEDLADMVAGTSFHAGEVKRNPFHLFLPPWMQDNVRRGSELVGGQGEAAPDFAFATLYRLRRWKQGRLENVFEGGKIVPSAADPGSLFA